MQKVSNSKKCIALCTVAAFAATAAATGTIEPVQTANGKIQKIRFVEDDAQNYMVSKIYELKHRMANDVVPFVLGAVKRYAANGSADRINYKAGGKQFVAVSCPVPLMPYIDDMISKLDRPVANAKNRSGIDGTGIIRTVFTPQYRSSEKMMNVMIKAGIPSNATEGANQDATVAFDAETNRIYWKDSINKNKDMLKYLAWLDRPLPQFTVALNVYEVRESDLLDLGVDYLAWKNGPGLNLLDIGASFLEGSALSEAFGPYGFFMFAPSFDFSFLRMLQQNGRARIATSARLTVVTGHDAALNFTPTYQNMTKDDKFASAVTGSPNNKLELKITNPVISLSGKTDRDGRLGSTPADYEKQAGVLNFAYQLAMKNVVERDNHGNELFCESESSSAVAIRTGNEHMLARWTQEMEVEQTIGVPFLCELPVLKYIFGTTTVSQEKHFYFLSVQAELMHPDSDISRITGSLIAVPELVGNQK